MACPCCGRLADTVPLVPAGRCAGCARHPAGKRCPLRFPLTLLHGGRCRCRRCRLVALALRVGA